MSCFMSLLPVSAHLDPTTARQARIISHSFLFGLLGHDLGAQPLGPLVEGIISQDLQRFSAYAKKVKA